MEEVPPGNADSLKCSVLNPASQCFSDSQLGSKTDGKSQRKYPETTQTQLERGEAWEPGQGSSPTSLSGPWFSHV